MAACQWGLGSVSTLIRSINFRSRNSFLICISNDLIRLAPCPMTTPGSEVLILIVRGSLGFCKRTIEMLLTPQKRNARLRYC